MRALDYRTLFRLSAFLLVAGSPLFANTPHPGPEEPQAAPAPGSPTKKRIHVGMPAAELRELIGKPEKVVPVQSEKARATHTEVWIYRRLLRSSNEEVPIGTRPIMGRRKSGDGSWTDVVLSNETVYKMRRTDTYQVASFLIVDGKYVACTLTEEKSQSYF